MRLGSPKRWEEISFGSVVAHSAFGPRFSGDDYAEDGNVATLRTTDLDDHGRISYESMPLARLNEDNYANHLLKPGDLVITRSGTCGIAAVFEGFSLPVLPGAFLIRFRLNDRADPRYFRYYFNSPFGRTNILSVARGAVQQNLNITNVETLRVALPPLDTQREIVATISAYDELMENNRRRMELLEESARLLYREWFVRLRFPGHEHARLSHGIPEGWERKKLIEVCGSLEDGDWIESKDQSGEDYRLLQISNIGMNDFVETENYRFISQETFRRLNCREVKLGDLLISRMPTPIGRAWLVTEMPWKMVTAVDAAILTTDDTVADRYFLLHHLNSPSSIEHCERRAGGATRPRVARRELAGIPVLLPSVALQKEFREIVKPINEQRANLYRQNQKLRAARDLLLPRLMSGEIAV